MPTARKQPSIPFHHLQQANPKRPPQHQNAFSPSHQILLSASLNMLDAAGQLAAAQIALYALLILPSVYAAWKHGWQGLLGWGFLVAFCLLRLIGSALQVSNETNGMRSQTTQIISGVGLSPLVLTIVGLLHEMYVFCPTFSAVTC